MIEYKGQLKDYEFKIKKKRTSHHKLKNGEYNYKFYNHSIITFDIETTSAWVDKNGAIIRYHTGRSSEYWNELTPLSLCYIWQCSVDGTVYYGRELKSFLKLLDDLPKEAESIIWVHNLAYEFHFLYNIITWDEVFARAPHKPMKAKCAEYPLISWRCTYMLTRLSLDSWGKQLGIHKLTGNLNYEKMRTPLTPLTSRERAYCEYDCLIVEAGIKWYLKEYATQWDIPLTQTGTVRRVVKDILTSNKEYLHDIKKLVPENAKQYKLLQTIFAGGYTHANRLYAGHVIKGIIEHYDFASSYPYVMISEKFPSTPWVYTGLKHIPKEETFNDFAYIFYIEFTHIRSISFNTYIQGSKVLCDHIDDMLLDNGRLISVPQGVKIGMYMTEQDYLTIKENYEWDEMDVIRVWKSRKRYLPAELIEYILYLYNNKTMLKDVKGEEDLYMQSKQYVNSIFGMSVTAIVQTDVKLVGDTWIIDKLTEDIVNEKLDALKNQSPYEKRYFLNYSWGCWITAYARRNLWKCIHSIDHDVIYADTDSIFCRGRHDFTWYNEEVIRKINESARYYDYDPALTRPLSPKGEAKQIGFFAREDDCSEFITLGAKRYCERRCKDGKLHLTVSGINKGAVHMLKDNIYNFKDGFNFDKDDPFVNKRMSIYISDQEEIRWPDGYVSDATHGINMRRNGYKLEMTDEYKLLIKYKDMSVDDLPDSYFIAARGRW